MSSKAWNILGFQIRDAQLMSSQTLPTNSTGPSMSQIAIACIFAGHSASSSCSNPDTVAHLFCTEKKKKKKVSDSEMVQWVGAYHQT